MMVKNSTLLTSPIVWCLPGERDGRVRSYHASLFIIKNQLKTGKSYYTSRNEMLLFVHSVNSFLPV